MVLTDIRSKRAFTLVELAIVIVIVGLLTGGIIAGKSLIHASELRSVAADYTKFISAENNFRSQYGAKPGDLTKATTYWQIRAGSGSDATCYDTISTTVGTCNGNGDGFLTDNGASPLTSPEWFLFWQHLANAGLIQGTYTGSTAVAASVTQTKANSPVSRLSDTALWYVRYLPGPISGSASQFDGQYGTEVIWAANKSSSRDPLLTPREAWDIDTKMDDGSPATGTVYSLKASSPWGALCSTTDSVTTAAYSLTRTDKVCLLYMELPK